MTSEVITRSSKGCIPDEFNDEELSNQAFTLSMANTGIPDSGGSQFFVNLKANPSLDHWRDDLGFSQCPVFGKLCDAHSIKVIQAIATVQVNNDDCPIQPVKIHQVICE